MPKREIVKYIPLLLGLAGLPALSYYVEMSRGVGRPYAEIRRASADGMIAELLRLQHSGLSPILIADTNHVVTLKVLAAYTKGHQLLAPVKEYMYQPKKGDHVVITADEMFDLKDAKSGRAYNSFKADLRVRDAQRNPADIQLLASGSVQQVLNRRPTYEHDKPVTATPWQAVRNHLIFIESDRGLSYFSRNRLLTSLFPVEADDWFKGGTFSGIGRDLLFKVVNPTATVRCLLNISTMNRQGEFRQIPPAHFIGAERVDFSVGGAGSARIVSPPVHPQFIDQQAYVALDMGREGVAIKEERSGLMTLFNVKVPRDYRRLVGLAREISVISEDEYQQLAPPEYIANLPGDLGNPALEYSGIYEDGWMGKSAFLRLSQPAVFSPLVIRGSIPGIGGTAFSDEVSVHVDGKELARKVVGVGEFDLRLSAPEGGPKRLIEIGFTKQQQLPGEDRQVSLFIRCIGFSPTGCEADPRSSANVFSSGESIYRGNGWYPLETHQKVSFHWAKSGAEILAGPATNNQTLLLDIEPGPAQVGHPLRFEVREGQAILSSTTLNARSQVLVRLPNQLPAGERAHTIKLLALDPSKAAAGADPRTLDFRIFRASLQAGATPEAPHTQDIASPAQGIDITKNWQPIEIYKGELFRWVDNDAGFRIADPTAFPDGLAIELEPGPGIAPLPMVLRVFDSAGRQVQAYEVAGREKLIFPLPAGTRKASTFRLHADNGGKKIASDPRILNFRVFRIATNSKFAETGPEIARDPSITLGSGWYPLEHYQNDIFRWVDNDAKLVVKTPGVSRIAIDVAPGPGLGGQPLLLKIFDATGHQVQAIQVKGRQVVNFYPPANTKSGTFTLHADGGGKRAAGDPRILNFRVFSITPAK